MVIYGRAESSASANEASRLLHFSRSGSARTISEPLTTQHGTVTYVSEHLSPMSPVCTLRERAGVRVVQKAREPEGKAGIREGFL